MSLNIEKMASEIAKGLEDYSKLTVDELQEASKKVADETVKILKETSPKDTGKYAKSWKSTKTKADSSQVSYVVHNKDFGWLVHLLEDGHAKRNGGRTRAFPHVAPAREQAAELMEEELKRRLG